MRVVRASLPRLARSLCPVLAAACSTPPPSPRSPAAKGPAVVLSIVATNDVHGQLERLPFVASAVDTLRKVRSRDGGVLLVDGGDAFQGTIESNENEGHAIVEAFSTMGYAAMALGNHEFDFGPPGEKSVPRSPGDDPQGALEARVAEARFPVLAANLSTERGALPPWKNLSASAETIVAGVRVGLVGLLTADAPDVIKRPDFAGLHVTPLAEAATREARALRARGAEVVVVVAHAGGECKKTDDPRDLSSCDPDSEIFRLARDVPAGLVDAIVGGHRNANVAHVVNGVPIVHAESNLLAFSRVDLVIDPGTHRVVESRVFPPRVLCTGPTPATCNAGDYEGVPIVPSPAVTAAIAPALHEAEALRSRPVGVRVERTFPVDKMHEMALGNLFADLMREAVPGSDGAFGNAGSVRDVLPEGDLTFGRLHHVMPFDNQLAKLALTGKQLRALVAANLGQNEHGILSFSGISVDAGCAAGGLDVMLKHPDGAAVRDDEPLTLVTNDFLALGGDGLLGPLHLPDASIELLPDTTVLGALAAGLARRKTVTPDDPALFDPKHPRERLRGELPFRCDRAP